MTTPARAIADGLAGARVRYLFGVPGGGNNLDVIGACEAAGLTFVLAHTETAAAIMAAAHAELTDTVGACVVTRGPGAASAVNGAAAAQQDRTPLLLLCDTVGEDSRVRIAHQQLDQRAMFAPVTKWSATVGAADVVADAIRVATRAPRGAVHLDVDPTSSAREAAPQPPRLDSSIDDLAARVAAARRPLVIVGVGARAHAPAVRALVSGTRVPVSMTYKAKGIVPDDGPNSAGVFTGSRTDGRVLAEADLIVAIGLDSIELIPNPWDYDVPVVALSEYRDPHPYLEPAVTVIGPLDSLIADLPPLVDEWPLAAGPAHRAAIDAALAVSTPNLEPHDVVRAVRAAAPAGSVATVDAGAHMLVAMALWSTQDVGEVLISSGLATMGYALPAAIGAALARPDRRIYCFIGDGGLQMCLGELETLARLWLNVTVVVFNDRTLSLIKAKQLPSGHGGADAVEYVPTDFATAALSHGVQGFRVETEADLVACLAEPVDGPVLLDAQVGGHGYPHVIDVTRNAVLPN